MHPAVDIFPDRGMRACFKFYILATPEMLQAPGQALRACITLLELSNRNRHINCHKNGASSRRSQSFEFLSPRFLQRCLMEPQACAFNLDLGLRYWSALRNLSFLIL
mmetsp:Transcript_18475/g.36268  ORF Transcript_18475/g.36268 Transcript_18475/m.36268 type:complete len:107 (+) Transcript_18475:294-614(+)